MKVLAAFKSENKIERYVAIDDTDQKSKIYLLTEEEMIAKVKGGEFLASGLYVDKNNIIRIKLNAIQQAASKLVVKTSIKNGDSLKDVITGNFPVFKSKHFDGISHGFVVGAINQICLQTINGREYPFVLCTFLAKAGTMQAFERVIHTKFKNSLIKFSNYGEYGQLLAQVEDFLTIAGMQGVIINPNSAKHTLPLSEAVSEFLETKPVTDEAIINKVYNKLATIEKNLLG